MHLTEFYVDTKQCFCPRCYPLWIKSVSATCWSDLVSLVIFTEIWKSVGRNQKKMTTGHHKQTAPIPVKNDNSLRTDPFESMAYVWNVTSSSAVPSYPVSSMVWLVISQVLLVVPLVAWEPPVKLFTENWACWMRKNSIAGGSHGTSGTTRTKRDITNYTILLLYPLLPRTPLLLVLCIWGPALNQVIIFFRLFITVCIVFNNISIIPITSAIH